MSEGCCINVLESQGLLWSKPRWTNLSRPYNGISNALVHMKINKTVKKDY